MGNHNSVYFFSTGKQIRESSYMLANISFRKMHVLIAKKISKNTSNQIVIKISLSKIYIIDKSVYTVAYVQALLLIYRQIESMLILLRV